MRRSRLRKKTPLAVDREIGKSLGTSWLIVWVLGLFILLPSLLGIVLYGGVLAWAVFILSSGIIAQSAGRIRRLKRMRKALLNNPDMAHKLRVDEAPDLGKLMFWLWH